jgi:hypothetical protein
VTHFLKRKVPWQVSWGILGSMGVFVLSVLLWGTRPALLIESLLLGWYAFLNRVLPAIRPDSNVVLLGIGCLIALTIGLHLFLRSLRPTWHRRSTVALVTLLGVLFASGVSAFGLLRQTEWLFASSESWFVNRGRDFSHAQAAADLKQMTMAMANRASEVDEDRFVPGTTRDAKGRELHGWTTLLLPYLPYEDLFRRIDLNKPWDDPVHDEVFRTRVSVFLVDPATPPDADGRPVSQFAGNVRVLGLPKPLSYRELEENGASHIIVFGEARGNFRAWGHPVNLRDPARGIDRSPDGFGNSGASRRATRFGMADGSVRTFSSDADPEFLEWISNPLRTKP